MSLRESVWGLCIHDALPWRITCALCCAPRALVFLDSIWEVSCHYEIIWDVWGEKLLKFYWPKDTEKGLTSTCEALDSILNTKKKNVLCKLLLFILEISVTALHVPIMLCFLNSMQYVMYNPQHILTCFVIVV